MFTKHQKKVPTCQTSTCCLSVTTLVPLPLQETQIFVQTSRNQAGVTAAFPLQDSSMDKVPLTQAWQTQKCVGKCVCARVCAITPLRPFSETVLAVSPALSARLCELKPASGRNLGRHSCPTEVICTNQIEWNKSQSSGLAHVQPSERVAPGHRREQKGSETDSKLLFFWI